ncbi:MAG: PaaI family thioesterase [candidate division KSB1 bacterium]
MEQTHFAQKLMPTLQARNPDFERTVRESFARQQFMHTLGATLAKVAAGAVDIALDYDAALSQQNGFLHAGVITSIADSACGYAALSLMPAGSEVLSVEFKVNLLAPARNTSFLAQGRVLKSGRTLTVCQGEVYGIAAGERSLIASMLATMIARTAPA